MKRVLIIAGGLQVGGAERVAANIGLYDENKEFEFHYIVFEGIENVYGAEIEASGGKVFTLPSPGKGYYTYIKKLRNLMKKYKYAVVHSHTMFNSGINLLVAKMMKVPCRIAHSHTTKTEVRVSKKQKIYEWFMRKIIKYTATHLFACGIEAGKWLFGEKLFLRKGVVIKNGIDTFLYSFSEENRKKVRQKYDAEDKFIIGHSGTIIPLKNQEFLVELMPRILHIKDNAVLWLMGGGNKDSVENLRKKIKQLDIEDNVVLCGCLSNVNEYLSAIDVFAFPSKREGTPLALLEAQANGLPCIISDAVPDDVKVTKLIKKVPLDDKEGWIQNLCNSKRDKRENYGKQIAEQGFDTKKTMEKIYLTYREV